MVAKPVESARGVIHIYTTLIGTLCGGQFCCLGKSWKTRICVNVIRFLEATLGEDIFKSDGNFSRFSLLLLLGDMDIHCD